MIATEAVAQCVWAIAMRVECVEFDVSHQAARSGEDHGVTARLSCHTWHGCQPTQGYQTPKPWPLTPQTLTSVSSLLSQIKAKQSTRNLVISINASQQKQHLFREIIFNMKVFIRYITSPWS